MAVSYHKTQPQRTTCIHKPLHIQICTTNVHVRMYVIMKCILYSLKFSRLKGFRGSKNGRKKFIPQNFKFVTDVRHGWKLDHENFTFWQNHEIFNPRNFRLYGITCMYMSHFICTCTIYTSTYMLQDLFQRGGQGVLSSPPPLSNWLSLSLIWGCPPLNFGIKRLPPLERNPEINTDVHVLTSFLVFL